MYVCMYVCMYVPYVCMHVCICMYMVACISFFTVFMYERMHNFP